MVIIFAPLFSNCRHDLSIIYITVPIVLAQTRTGSFCIIYFVQVILGLHQNAKLRSSTKLTSGWILIYLKNTLRQYCPNFGVMRDTLWATIYIYMLKNPYKNDILTMQSNSDVSSINLWLLSLCDFMSNYISSKNITS